MARAGPDVRGRGGTAQEQKRGRGTRLVVLLSQNLSQSSSGQSFSSRLTMSSHLLEQPPPLHNNNNNCEEGEQPLPPPAGLNSECWAGGLGEGDGGGGSAPAASASSPRGGGVPGGEGSPLVQAEDVRVTDSFRHLSGCGACVFPRSSLPLLLGVLGRGLLLFSVRSAGGREEEGDDPIPPVVGP